MEHAVLIAKILGPTYLIIGLGALINGPHIAGVLRELAKSPLQIYLGGVWALLIGTLIVRLHPEIRADWTLLITLLGWAAIAKGAIRILAPEQAQGMIEKNVSWPKIGLFYAVSALIMGAILTAGGYGWIT